MGRIIDKTMKKLIILFIAAGIMISSCGPSRKLQTTSRAPNVALELINIGAYSNDPSADRARTAFDKANGPIREYNRLQLYYLEPTELAILRGATVTTAELNRLSGVTSAIQTQINGRIRSVDSTGTAPGNYVTRKALVDSVALKANIASPTFTGTVTGTFIGNLTGNVTGDVSGNAGTVTGFTPASGSLALSGADALTLTTTAATNVTLPTTGTLIGSTTYQPDQAAVDGTNVHFLEGADTLYNPPPYDMRDDAATLFPTIQSAAGDTSNYTVPDKIGDLYIDTSAGKVYVSVTSSRGGWRILNYILPLFFIVSFKRRKRK